MKEKNQARTRLTHVFLMRKNEQRGIAPIAVYLVNSKARFQ